MSQKRFLPSFGATSAILAVSVLGFGWGAAQLLNVLREQFPGSRVPYYWSVGMMILMPLLAFTAVCFGIAAIFGYGKVNGTSRRFLAVVGILLGGLLGLAWVSAPLASSAIRQHVANQEHDVPVVYRDAGFELLLPGDDWQVLQGEGLEALGPLAVTAVVRSLQTDDEIVGMVLVEELTEDAPDTIDLTLLAEGCFESLTSDDKQMVFVKEISHGGQPAVMFQAIVQDNEQPLRWQEMLLFSKGRLLRAIAFGTQERTEQDGSTFQPFYEAFHLVNTSSKPD